MDDETILSKNRLEVLTDAIFAVVMTLLDMDRKRYKALDTVVDSGHSVKCQKCGIAVPMPPICRKI